MPRSLATGHDASASIGDGDTGPNCHLKTLDSASIRLASDTPATDFALLGASARRGYGGLSLSEDGRDMTHMRLQGRFGPSVMRRRTVGLVCGLLKTCHISSGYGLESAQARPSLHEFYQIITCDHSEDKFPAPVCHDCKILLTACSVLSEILKEAF